MGDTYAKPSTSFASGCCRMSLGSTLCVHRTEQNPKARKVSYFNLHARRTPNRLSVKHCGTILSECELWRLNLANTAGLSTKQSPQHQGFEVCTVGPCAPKSGRSRSMGVVCTINAGRRSIQRQVMHRGTEEPPQQEPSILCKLSRSNEDCVAP